MPILFSVDTHSGVPIYLQLIDQVKRAVAVSAVLPGEQLPTVKTVALDLTVNANTVLRAYRELERDGIVETSQGRGTFVRGNGVASEAAASIRAMASETIDHAVREARSLGVARADLHDIVEASIARWFGNKKQGDES